MDICCDYKGNIWMAAGVNLYFYEGNEWIRYDKNIGLPNNTISSVDVGTNGKVYIGTAYYGTYIMDYYTGIGSDKLIAKKLENIFIHPNPTTNYIRGSIPYYCNYTISVFDTKGIELINNAGIGKNIYCDISKLPKGIYIIKIKTPNDFFTSQFIKQ